MRLATKCIVFFLLSFMACSQQIFADELLDIALRPKTALPAGTVAPVRNDSGVYVFLHPAAKARFVAGEEPVWVEAWLERDAGFDRKMNMVWDDPLNIWSISVKRTDKQESVVVPMTAQGELRKWFYMPVSALRVPFEPNESHRICVHLNRMFDLSRPGIYTVTLSAKFGESGKGLVTVESNPIQIEIVEPKGPTWLTPAPEAKQ